MATARVPWWHQVRAVAAWDWALLRGHPRLRWAVIGLLFVPALYAVLALSSVWDPASHSRALPVGLVNGDRGAAYRGRDINLGAQLVASLQAGALFDYRHYDDPELARHDVRIGKLDFMIQIPSDFSRRAVPGELAGAAQLLIVTSEGNDYVGAGFARRFAPEVTARVNAMLNEARWGLVLDTAQGSQRSLQSLRESLGQVGRGAQTLHEGLVKARDGAAALQRQAAQATPGVARLQSGSRQSADAGAQFAGGFRQLSGTLRAMDSRRPPEADLLALRQGARALADGHRDLGHALEQAQAGALKLDEGLVTLREAADGIPLVGGRVAEGAGELRAGSLQLAQGLGRIREGQASLAQGALRLDEGVAAMTDGVQRSATTLSQIVSRLPEDARLDAFVTGLRELQAGTAALEAGVQPLEGGVQSLHGGLGRLEEGGARLAQALALLADSLPGGLDAPGGSASGMAASVESKLEIEAPVANQGTALAANFVPLALWVGVVMTAFLLHLRRLAEPTAGLPRSALVAGKLLLPLGVVLVQALGMLAVLAFGFGVPLPQPGPFALVLATASATFLAVVFLLVRLLGDLGKALALLLLIVQIGAGGALLPIQLTSEPFQTLHPLLPFTWVVKAFRASLFGAFDGDWLMPWTVVAAIGLVALLAAAWLGRWRVVPVAAWRPALDLD